VFGLGNSKTYPERFQAVGIAVDKRISELGAHRLLDRGIGDDNGGWVSHVLDCGRCLAYLMVECSIDNDFAQWKTKFMTALDAYTGEASTAPPAA
jgi:sulfite reductase alpha subunit-like flavoprotein